MSVKGHSVRTFDPVLKQWFRAASQDALLLVLNSPHYVNMRNAHKARMDEEVISAANHCDEQLRRAQAKRDRKNAVRARTIQATQQEQLAA